MSTARRESPFLRRLLAELHLVPRALFWLGFLCFAFGQLVTFLPEGNQSLFTIAAVLTAFGLLDRHRRVRIAAFIFLILSTLSAFDGHKHSIVYQRLVHLFDGPAPTRLNIP